MFVIGELATFKASPVVVAPTLVTEPPAGIAAQVLSPLKYVVASAVPVAERSAVTVTDPVTAASGVRSIKLPSVVVTVLTMSAGTEGIDGKVTKLPRPLI